jgi:hypothetical protein
MLPVYFYYYVFYINTKRSIIAPLLSGYWPRILLAINVGIDPASFSPVNKKPSPSKPQQASNQAKSVIQKAKKNCNYSEISHKVLECNVISTIGRNLKR